MLGAFWTLYVTGTPMDSIGWIGIILVGVVVNNGIVLIDKIHRLRINDGFPPRGGHRGRGCAGAASHDSAHDGGRTLPMATSDAPPRASTTARCRPAWPAVCVHLLHAVVALSYTLIDDLSHRIGWVVRRAVAGSSRRALGPAEIRRCGGAAAPAAPASADVRGDASTLRGPLVRLLLESLARP